VCCMAVDKHCSTDTMCAVVVFRITHNMKKFTQINILKMWVDKRVFCYFIANAMSSAFNNLGFDPVASSDKLECERKQMEQCC